MRKLFRKEGNASKSVKELRTKCNWTSKGRPGCKTYVCSDCYKTFDHDIKFNKWKKDDAAGDQNPVTP